MPRPDIATVPVFYHNYINLVKESDVIMAIENNSIESLELFRTVPQNKWGFRYKEDKWSIKEMLQHIIDAERIFCYRALCFARQEKSSLPGFDENSYAAVSEADKRSGEDLLLEFEWVRKSTELLFQSFNFVQLSATGTANNNQISVNAIGFITAGHVQHHMQILKERYL